MRTSTARAERPARRRRRRRQETTIDQQAATITQQERGLRQQAAVIDRMRLEQERIEAELRIVRRERAEVPRTVGDLYTWREDRDLTQAKAAELLKVGRATIERAEAQDHDAPLDRALRRAFDTHGRALRAVENERGPVDDAKGSNGRSRAERGERR